VNWNFVHKVIDESKTMDKHRNRMLVVTKARFLRIGGASFQVHGRNRTFVVTSINVAPSGSRSDGVFVAVVS